MEDTLQARIARIASEQFGVSEDKLTTDTQLTDLGMDSLDVVEFIMALELEFDVSIPDDIAEKIKTYGDIIEYAQQNFENQSDAEATSS